LLQVFFGFFRAERFFTIKKQKNPPPYRDEKIRGTTLFRLSFFVAFAPLSTGFVLFALLYGEAALISPFLRLRLTSFYSARFSFAFCLHGFRRPRERLRGFAANEKEKATS